MTDAQFTVIQVYPGFTKLENNAKSKAIFINLSHIC